jgi:hypothetical protein
MIVERGIIIERERMKSSKDEEKKIKSNNFIRINIGKIYNWIAL